ncbi:MAG: hypothetical protein IPL33_19975 [Sphingobacteriales bacterium]|nr:hypothetical protein [Sphingobacteriales bacterium]
MLSCLLLGKIALVGQLTEYFECGTESNFPNLMAGISMPDASAIMMTESVPLTVRLYLHIMRQSDGTGGRSDEEIATALNNLYSVYSPHGIFFEVGCIDYIDNDDAYCDPAIDPLFPYVTTDNALNVYKNFPIHSDGIDAFIFCPLNGEAHWSGRAPTIPSAVFSVMGLNSDPSIDGFTSMTFAHEIGHCFGLFHTHYGTCNDGVPGTPDGLGGIICAELPVPLGMEDASFANGAICGDYLADTRASKMLDSRDMDCSSAKTRSCEDVPPTEYPYIPQLDNIMSYKHPNCITNLTSGQGYRARWHLQNVPILQACLVQSVTPMPIDIVIEPGTTVWDGEYNIAITQNVIIPDGATLRIENTRRTFQGSQLSITVQKGGVLHLNNSTLMAGYGCNGSSWQGIRVEGSNTPHPSDYLTNGSSEHGIVIVEHNSSIQNATIGILAYQEEGMGLAGLGGGIIYANESTFKNNQTAISIMPHIQTQRSQISECYFINEMPFLNANGTINTEPYCQILLWGSGPVAITDNVFETASTQIGIQGTGIRAIDADVRIGVDSAGETLGNLFSNVFRGVDIYGFFSAAAATHVRGAV